VSRDPGEQQPGRTKRAWLPALALIVVAVALIGFGSVWLSRGASTGSSSAPSSVAVPTAVPTLDFFRGRSYPTPTPLSSP
jgi:hypothetical protein